MWRTCAAVVLLVACKGGDKSEPQAEKKVTRRDKKPDAELVLPKVASRDAIVKVVPTAVRGIVTLDAKGDLTVAATASDWRTEPVDGKATPLVDLMFELAKIDPGYEALAAERVAQDDPPPPPDDEDLDDVGGTGTAMALEEGKMGKKDSDRAEGQYRMKRDTTMKRVVPFAKQSFDHVVDVPVGDLTMRPLVLAHPEAPGQVLAKLLVATGGGAIAVAFDGKPDVLRIGFDSAVAHRSSTSRVEVILEKTTVKALADDGGDTVLWDKPFEAGAFVKALGARPDIAVLVGDGVSVQRVIDVALALADRTIALGPLKGTLADREAAFAKGGIVGDALADPFGSTTGGPARSRRAAVPSVAIGQPQANGDLDKAIIRRYITRNKAKIQYCYEKELLAKPTLAGTVVTSFLIDGTGKVAAANASGVAPEVATCVADVIKGIAFPAPKGGGNVQVNYPFIFHISGGD